MRIAAYLRVSSDQQADKMTFETQIDVIEKFCRERPDLPLSDVKWYGDSGVSGGTEFAERAEGMVLRDREVLPPGGQLMADIMAGKIDTLIVYKLDRLSRDEADFYISLNAFKRKRVRFILAADRLEIGPDPLDYESLQKRGTLSMLVMMAFYEKGTIKLRTGHGSEKAARAGGWMGGLVPWGYTLDRNINRLVVNEDEAPIIREMFRLVAEEGWTTGEVGRWLTAKNVPLPAQLRGKKMALKNPYWRHGQVWRILHNRTYMGKHVYGKYTRDDSGGTERRVRADKAKLIERECAAIVSEELFLAAAQALQGNASAFKRHKNSDKPEPVTMLNGLIKCSHCGGTFNYMMPHGNKRKDGTYSSRRKFYYRCSQYSNNRPGHRCEGGFIDGTALTEKVWSRVVEFVSNPSVPLAMLERQILQQQADAEPIEVALARIDKELDDKDREQTSYAVQAAKGWISEDKADLLMARVNGDIQLLREKREDLLVQRIKVRNLQARLRQTTDLLAEMRKKIRYATDEDQRKICQLLVSEIRITTGHDAEGKRVVRADIDYCFDLPGTTVYTDATSGSPYVSQRYTNTRRNFLILKEEVYLPVK